MCRTPARQSMASSVRVTISLARSPEVAIRKKIV
jgi:hypothetical protein